MFLCSYSVINDNIPWNGGHVWGDSPDIVAFLVTVVITLIVAMKVKVSLHSQCIFRL